MSVLTKLNVGKPRSREAITLANPEAAAIAAEWVEAKHQSQAAEAALDIAASKLTPLTRVAWLHGNTGLSKPVNSVEVPSAAGIVLASYASVWSPKGGIELVPPDLRCERFTIRVSGDKVPAAKAEEFVSRLLALAAEMGCEDAVSATGAVAPVPEFNTVRHTRLTVAENLRAEELGLSTRVSLRLR